jgi:hypothetical protein
MGRERKDVNWKARGRGEIKKRWERDGEKETEGERERDTRDKNK